MKNLIRRLVWSIGGLLIVGLIVYGFLPKPIDVDLAEVSRGALQVTVDEDGKTRIKEKYIVSAPLGGRLLRINLDPGDHVTSQQTVLASLAPSDPTLLDARAIAQADARVKAAQAALNRADPLLEQARLALDSAEVDLGRQRQLFEKNAASQQALDDAELLFRTRSEEYRSARFAREIAEYELQQAQAALVRTQPQNDANATQWQFDIQSPIDGAVLRILQESSAVVTPGMPLLELGDPQDLEIEIDVLSSDAVKIGPGDRVIIEHWGGPYPLEGRVRLVEPSAFTKISALGVEEQRVFVIVDLVEPIERRKSLGDGFRIEGRIVIWESDDVIKVPTSALFRDADQEWAVFRVEEATIRQVQVEIGQSNGLEAQILSGLEVGDQVVMHPSDQVAEGVRISSELGK
ncbi:MAG: HlyD family efflux transporter periplasmic adaptor subunit [Pirellulaceae bacterium]